MNATERKISECATEPELDLLAAAVRGFDNLTERGRDKLERAIWRRRCRIKEKRREPSL